MVLTSAGKTFAIENPFASFLWVLRLVQRLIRFRMLSWCYYLLHQCCYGAQTLKPTGVLTIVPWMKTVRSLCYEVRARRDLKKGWLEECGATWRRNRFGALLYPLSTHAVCALHGPRHLRRGCQRQECYGWNNMHSMMVQGRWKNQLVRTSAMKVAVETNKAVQSVKDLRNEENAQAVGGLRSAR